MKPRFFRSGAEWRRWLERYHGSRDELLVGFWKRGTGKPSLTWPESVDQALCFGWIDGTRRRIDDQRYSIRFTPRRKGSIWSRVNRRRMRELMDQGLAWEAGVAAFQRHNRQNVYAYERPVDAVLTAAMQREFRKSPAAWRWFSEQPPSYRRQAAWYVISAKQAETRQRRLSRLIAASAARVRLGARRERP